MASPDTALHGLARNVARLMVLAWEHQPVLVIASSALSALSAAMPFLRAGAVALLIDALISAGTATPLPLAGAIMMMIVASVAPEAVSGLLNFVTRLFCISMDEAMELLFLRRKGEIDLAVYEDPKFNDLLNRAEACKTVPMTDLLQSQFSNIQNVVGLATASAILVAFDWRVFVVILLGTTPKLLIEARYGRGIWGIYREHAEARRRFLDLRGHFYDFWSLAELKLFQNARHFHRLLSALLADFNNHHRRTERHKLLWQAGTTACAGLALSIAIVCFVRRVASGQMTIGTMTFALGAIGAMQTAFSGFVLNIARQYQFSLFVTDLFRVIDTKPMLPQAKHPKAIDASAAPGIVFENVSFAYPGTDKLVLRRMSLAIEAGERLAIVGVNGAGKTTLIKLLCRVYDPTEGRILVNGCDLRDVDVHQWHSMLSVLFQDYATYHFPVKEVIALGRRSGSAGLRMNDVQRAARWSGAATFIRHWKDGYEQMLGRQFTGGLDPSKGQLQRLALARSFYRDARLMILDEPTSSIDAEGEAQIFERFERLSRNATVILISHRFSTVRKADRICVIQDGTIGEVGTHRELLACGGVYADLFHLQAAGYDDIPATV